MNNLSQDEMELIKQYRFAPLPPRIERQDEERKEEPVSDKVAVQCQVCGRVGMLNLEEMKKHHEQHEQ